MIDLVCIPAWARRPRPETKLTVNEAGTIYCPGSITLQNAGRLFARLHRVSLGAGYIRLDESSKVSQSLTGVQKLL